MSIESPTLQIFRPEASYGFGTADFVDMDFVASTFTGPLSIRGNSIAVGGFYPEFLLGGLTGCTFAEEEGDGGDPGPEPIGDPPFPPVWPYPIGNIYQREFWSMNIQMIRADSKDFGFTAYDGDNAVIDLTSATIRFTAKYDYFDADASAVIKLDNGGLGGITVTSATDGEGEVNIPKTATLALPFHRVDLVYDLKVRLPSGKEHTIARGAFVVHPNATDSF